MGFIDKKQNVIDIVLTSYGKELLSKGILTFDYFKLIDENFLYSSSFDDYYQESLPIFESLSDVDVYKNNVLLDGETFVTNYPIVNVVNNLTASSIKRTTGNDFDSDSILSMVISNNNLSGTISRIESMKNRGVISDSSSSISFNKIYTNKKSKFLIQVEISSSSEQNINLLSSGSSFYVCDDNSQILNKSSEYNESDNIYEIVKIS